jgi:penicillin-binding protein A
MNRELRRVSLVVLAMFAALFVSSSVIQVIVEPELTDNPLNVRTLYASYDEQRGPILVGDTAIAQSVPVDDEYNYQRVYEQGELYAAITGYYTLNQGVTGIEASLNDELAGTSGDAFLSRLNAIFTGQEPQGNAVRLTIDPVVQQAAFEALGDQQGAVVAIEPATGRILALVSKPSFDPNTLAGHETGQVIAAYDQLVDDPADPLANRAIAGDLYPPASTFKVLMAAALIDSGQATADTTVPNPPALTLTGTQTTITNSEGGNCGGTEQVSLADALRLSCNIPFAEFGEQLGQQTIREYAERFGYNSSVEIPLASTPSRYPVEAESTDRVQLSAFGQGPVDATPLQVAMTTMAIANDGVLMQPTLVDSVLRPDLSELSSFEPREYGRPVSAETADAVTRMMISSVENGAATNARISGIDVAGKTGTAENAPGDPYTLWFTGFAPADDPRVAVAVVVENGGGRGDEAFGNQVAAPIARDVIEAVLTR